MAEPLPAQQRYLMVSPRFFVDACKATEPVTIRMAENVLPPDTRLVDVFVGPSVGGHVMVIVESDQFDGLTPNPLPPPVWERLETHG